MKLAIMQPYFFPYIGYWQLIHESDVFILLDDVQFMRHGWIERNRILNPNGGWQYIAIPLEKHTSRELIRNVVARGNGDWKLKLLGQLTHYRRVAPYYAAVRDAVLEVVEPVQDNSVCRINGAILRGLCKVLDVRTKFLTASECGFDYSEISLPGEWALRISQQMGAHEYINPANGEELFDANQFEASGIKLKFLKPDSLVYPRNGAFIPSLSIIDVLMFNGVEATKALLCRYTLESP